MKSLSIQKKMIVFLLFLVLCAVILIPRFDRPESFHELTSKRYSKVALSGMADYSQWDFEGLMGYAHTVALVTPVDELSPDNSFGIEESGDKYHKAYSVRKVEVIEYYKNEKNYGDTFEMAEKCVMLNDGTLVMKEDCYPMEKGDCYLVFLIDSGYGGYPLSISADNGKIDLTYLSLNTRKSLAAEALLEFDLLEPTPELTKEQLEETFVDFSSSRMGTEYYPVVLSTSYTKKGMELELEYTITDYGKLFIREKDAELS